MGLTQEEWGQSSNIPNLVPVQSLGRGQLAKQVEVGAVGIFTEHCGVWTQL